jgi:hypothetical protein
MTAGHAQDKPRKTSLPVAQRREQHKGMERHEQEALNALIGERVLHARGEPAELLKVSVRPLWPGCYRVNVFVGTDAASATIADSYFLEVDGDGNIVASTPAITTRYRRVSANPAELLPVPPTAAEPGPT